MSTKPCGCRKNVTTASGCVIDETCQECQGSGFADPPKTDGGGLRFNEGKPKLHLVPASLEEAVARVLEYGMTREKDPYPKNNWKRGMSYTTVIDSLMRHTKAYNGGETNDPDSGLPHTWHIACNVAFLIEYDKICPEKDDRDKND